MRGEVRKGQQVSRRRLLLAVALTPALAGAGACRGTGADTAPDGKRRDGERLGPVAMTLPDWDEVAEALGRPGSMMRENLAYHTAFLRHDLHVTSYGVTVSAGLALGSHVAFVRYPDETTLLMGDLVVTENELQPLSDGLHRAGIEQTAIHKHLLSQTPDIWWTHVHAHGRDAVALARGLRKALDTTATPDPRPTTKQQDVDLDTAGMDAALDCEGTVVDGVHKCLFIRRETVTDGEHALPPGLGSTSAFNFQPVGGGRAALHGDFALVADEVQGVLRALRRGGLQLVELHHHSLRDEPRLFFVHLWAVDDAVRLARGLRRAVDLTNVVAAPTVG